MKRWAGVVVCLLVGCTTNPWVRDGGAGTSGDVGLAGERPPFVEHEPIMPSGESIGPAFPAPAAVGREKSAVTVVPEIEPQAPPPPAAPTVREAWRESLAEVARRLAPYADREPGSLTSFARLRLLKLKREALLLLLLSDRFDSEECRQILEVFRRHECTNLEIEGLMFVLYQRLGESEKRNEALGYLDRESRGKPQFRLDEVCFCEKAVGFRAFVPVTSAVFPAGARVKIYGEFAGAATRSTPGGSLEQQIQVYLSLLDGKGTTVDTAEFLGRGQGTRTLAASEHADTRSYFVGEYLLPASLKPGRYQLRLSATDLVGQVEAQSVLAFEVQR